MARDMTLEKGKAKSPAQMPTTRIKATPNLPTKTNISTASHKHVPAHPKPATSINASKPQGSKTPASIDIAHRPTTPKPKFIDLPLSPTQKNRILTNTSPRSSSLSWKPVSTQKPASAKNLTSQKPVPSKSLKTPTKEVGKQRISHATPINNVKKSKTSMKKQEIGTGNCFSETKEQITSIPHEKIENLSIPNVPEAETQFQYQESCIPQDEEKIVDVIDKGTSDLVQEDQEPLDTEKPEVEMDQTDAIIATSESWIVVEQEDNPLDIKRQDAEDLEEQCIKETSSCNKGENVIACEDAIEEKKEELETKQETTLRKKDQVENGNEGNEIKETVGKEVEKKQEIENAEPKQIERAHWKKDSCAVSNDVIEETASKLREQRKNKVRALAGAFETVISLQETK